MLKDACIARGVEPYLSILLVASRLASRSRLLRTRILPLLVARCSLLLATRLSFLHCETLFLTPYIDTSHLQRWWAQRRHSSLFHASPSSVSFRKFEPARIRAEPIFQSADRTNGPALTLHTLPTLFLQHLLQRSSSTTPTSSLSQDPGCRRLSSQQRVWLHSIAIAYHSARLPYLQK